MNRIFTLLGFTPSPESTGKSDEFFRQRRLVNTRLLQGLLMAPLVGSIIGTSSNATAQSTGTVNAVEKIGTKLHSYRWYRDLQDRINRSEIDGKRISATSVPIKIRDVVLKFLKKNGLLTGKYASLNGEYNNLNEQNQLLVSLLDEVEVDTFLKSPKVTSPIILAERKVDIDTVDELWQLVEDQLGVNIDTFLKEYGKGVLIGGAGASTLAMYYFLKSAFRGNKIKRLNRNTQNLMRDLEDITSRLQTSAGVQNGPPNQATAKRIQEILRDLEASVQKNERLTDMIHKLEAQMQALSGNAQGGATPSSAVPEQILRDLQHLIETLKSQNTTLAGERDEAVRRLGEFEHADAVLAFGEQFGQTFEDTASKMRAIMAQMELKGVKGFGKAIRFTTEDCEKVKREYNSLLAELAAATPENEHGVLFTFPVTMYNEGEARIKEGNLRDGYSKIYGAYIIMTFIKSLRSQGGGDAQTEASGMSWEEYKGHSVFSSKISEILIQNTLIGEKLGTEVGKIPDFFKLFKFEPIKTSFAQINEEDFKATYRKLSKDLHPDINPGDSIAEACFKIVASGQAILKDESKFNDYIEALKLCYPEKFT